VKAIVQDRFGPADGLELRDIETPEIGATDVLVRVHAAGVDRGVWHVMTGLPYPIRLAGYGFRAPKHGVPGTDLAGIVVSVGPDVTRFAPGDEVFGTGTGTYAEFARAREDQLAAKPANLSFEQAAALPVSGVTALQALRDRGAVQPGENVLVIGASGGVGTFSVQLAKTFGAQVTGVCSTTKVDLVRSLGADHVVDYSREDFAATGTRYDLILDIGGNASLSRLRRALTPKGRLVIVGGETSGRWLGGTDRQVRAMILSMFVGQKLGTFIAAVKQDDLLVLAELAGAGQLTPAVDRTFSLDEAPKAIGHVEEGHARGKVVVVM
jgi:NADPH:quinone reductase-like Zn-dependent oxidoreductase